MKISTVKIYINLARQRRKLKDLAEDCGITKQSISTILKRGSCLPQTAGRIARALGVDVTEIMEDVGIDNSKGF